MITTEIGMLLKFSGSIASYYLLCYFSELNWVDTEFIVCLSHVLNRPCGDIVVYGWVM